MRMMSAVSDELRRYCRPRMNGTMNMNWATAADNASYWLSPGKTLAPTTTGSPLSSEVINGPSTNMRMSTSANPNRYKTRGHCREANMHPTRAASVGMEYLSK